jgi:hypothetical protein
MQGGIGRSFLWFLAGAALALFLVLFWYVKVGPPSDLKPKDQNLSPQPPAPKSYAFIPKVTFQDGEPHWELHKEEIQNNADPLLEAINRFLKESGIAPKAKLTAVRARGKQAELYFENLFEQSYGTDNDSLLLEGIFKAIKENSSFETVFFLESGKPAQTLGNLDVEGPQKIR